MSSIEPPSQSIPLNLESSFYQDKIAITRSEHLEVLVRASDIHETINWRGRNFVSHKCKASDVFSKIKRMTRKRSWIGFLEIDITVYNQQKQSKNRKFLLRRKMFLPEIDGEVCFQDIKSRIVGWLQPTLGVQCVVIIRPREDLNYGFIPQHLYELSKNFRGPV
ncbi:hypothetical protein BGW36DRAFT_362867 [Talaromyces proteolyticus]|uniref:Uncharacterized protein n=1 Tax=Talaromyces proteolyticus TaxID=1131652 RepID=A0AAD4KHC6_9EURO|nr:uncharacterized protein BGW36DRAFT_362867 [Talaromyces proteolyticus]KAH8691831.1 hypothetical protein BGW36DRAFT_362867 [Talaromyces proteolyticus]